MAQATIDMSYERIAKLEAPELRAPLTEQIVSLAVYEDFNGNHGFDAAAISLSAVRGCRDATPGKIFREPAEGQRPNYMKIEGSFRGERTAVSYVRTHYSIFPKPFAGRAIKKAFEIHREKVLSIVDQDPVILY